ncbi:DedA family protein [Paenibacillus sp. NPDC057886]|uniref:DedA family protein n=1 Tax=Paenibacillus sp. NPDC057886 TaxID=3346270 RepID=UPI0036D06373
MGDIINQILEVITGMGYWGILLGMTLEVIPSEIVLAYAGYLVYHGQLSLVQAVIFGTLGCLLQHVILYAIGRYGGRILVDKYGKYLHIKSKHVDMTERWFQKYGVGVVFTSRFIPVVRQAISIPAGIVKMNIFIFLLFSGLASIPWAILFVFLGKTLGENWKNINEIAAPYTQPFLWGAVGLMFIYVWFKSIKHKKSQ